MTIPAKLHNSLIGSKGCLVRSVMEECGGVHIHFPAEGSGVDRVTIRGPAGEVERAKKQLLQLAEEKVRDTAASIYTLSFLPPCTGGHSLFLSVLLSFFLLPIFR